LLIVRGKYRITSLSTIILPPISSKVIKYLVKKYGDESLSKLISSKGMFKPLQISPLFIGSKPLISRGIPLPPIKPNSVLSAIITISCNDIDPAVMELNGVFKTPYGNLAIELIELETVVMNKLGETLSRSKFFKIEFLTPTVLTAKYMIPPPLKVKSRKLPERHRLVPQPSFIFSYLLRLWNSIAEPSERIPGPAAGDWEAYKLGRLADVTLVEIDYKLRPETVNIGRDSKGRLRRVRGFTGWVIYECLSKKLLPIYRKLLGLANYLGIGRSRGIGLGLVRVRAIT